MESLVGALVGGVGFWLRGSATFARATGRGATTARIVAWAMPLAAFAWLLTPLAWWWCAALAVALWLGALPGWWGSLDLGRVEGAWPRDLALHTLRGVVWMAPAAAVLGLAGAAWWPPLLAGLSCGAAYEVGWRVWPARATEVGECLFGAACGAALLWGAAWR